MPSGSCRVYVGNLPHRTRERELDDIFYKAGRIRGIEVKKGGFGFVDFDSADDASYAVRKFNGFELHGRRLRVEASIGHTRSAPPKSSGYALRVTGVSSDKSMTWRDLKDWARRGGAVTYARISDNATAGYVEFASEKDLERALEELEDSLLLDCRVTVKRVDPITTRERSRSRERGRGGRERSPPRRSSRDRDRRRGSSRDRRDRRDSRDRNRRRSPSRSRSPRRKDTKDRDRSYRSRSRSPRARSASPAPRSSPAHSPARSRSRSRSPAGASPRDEARSRSRSPRREDGEYAREESADGGVMNLLTVEEGNDVVDAVEN